MPDDCLSSGQARSVGCSDGDVECSSSDVGSKTVPSAEWF